MKIIVGESPVAVTGKTKSLAIEQTKAALGRIRYRSLVTLYPTVERRHGRLKRPLKCGDGLHHRVDIDRRARQRGGELRYVSGSRSDALLDDFHLHRAIRLAHRHRAGRDGRLRLCLQRRARSEEHTSELQSLTNL